MRKKCPGVGWGDWKILPSGSPERVRKCVYDWRGSLLIVLNFDQKAIGRDIEAGENCSISWYKDDSRMDGGVIECARAIRLSMVTASLN
jgi:hypothetical protein